MPDSRQRIIAAWRAEFSELASQHQKLVAAGAAGQGGEGAAIRRRMKDLQKAIERLTENRQGQFRRQKQE